MIDSNQLTNIMMACSLLAEAIGVLSPARNVRRLMFLISLVACSFVIPIYVTTNRNITILALSIVLIFRILNSMRAIYERSEVSRLRSSLRRSSTLLGFVTLTLVGLNHLVIEKVITTDSYVLTVTISSFALVIGIVFVMSAARNINRSKLRASDRYLSDGDLPTVSVCIPARNETQQLAACLGSIIKSDYPKLEIIVLDDCSQDKTPEVIKGFAQHGVRFIPGKPTASGWIAKNQAYQALAEAASGQILIFCGVDVEVSRSSIRATIATMMARHKDMISVLPKGLQKKSNTRLLQPMRYWWELALPRRLFNRPPVLSTFWSISRDSFLSLGGMKAVRGSITPEGFFARELAKQDKYSFIISGEGMGVYSVKSLSDQWQTSIRTRYPRLRNRLENVLLIILAEAVLLLMPIIGLTKGLLYRDVLLASLAGLATFCIVLTHYLIVRVWGVSNILYALMLLPFAVVSEMIATIISMWRYEFGQVEWKGRDICMPVMGGKRRPSKALGQKKA